MATLAQYIGSIREDYPESFGDYEFTGEDMAIIRHCYESDRFPGYTAKLLRDDGAGNDPGEPDIMDAPK